MKLAIMISVGSMSFIAGCIFTFLAVDLLGLGVTHWSLSLFERLPMVIFDETGAFVVWTLGFFLVWLLRKSEL